MRRYQFPPPFPKSLVPYNYCMDTVTPIGITDWRNQRQPFGIKSQDRFGHIYCLGKTGVGKSSLLLSMAISDIEQNQGVCLIDPHGDIAEKLLHYIPPERIHDVIYFNPKDLDYPIGLNPLKAVHPNHHHLIVSGLISTFKNIWAETWGPRLEYILRFCLLTLLHYPEGTLLDIQPLLVNKDFRNRVLAYVSDTHIHAFWLQEFDKYSPALKSEAIAPILNKTGVFLASVPLRNIVGQKSQTFNIQQVLDEGSIFIANLSKGEIGEDASSLLGSILVTSIQLAALYRATQEEQTRKPFFLYVDECHSFVSLSFADILSEARKYKLSLFLAHQYIDQLDEKIQSAIFGNVGTIISFRIGADDAVKMAREFHPVFSESDLINLPLYSMLIKLMIDGATSKPFSALTLPVKNYTNYYKEQILTASRRAFGRSRMMVEKDILSSYYIQTNAEMPTLFSE